MFAISVWKCGKQIGCGICRRVCTFFQRKLYPHRLNINCSDFERLPVDDYAENVDVTFVQRAVNVVFNKSRSTAKICTANETSKNAKTLKRCSSSEPLLQDESNLSVSSDQSEIENSNVPLLHQDLPSFVKVSDQAKKSVLKEVSHQKSSDYDKVSDKPIKYPLSELVLQKLSSSDNGFNQTKDQAPQQPLPEKTSEFNSVFGQPKKCAPSEQLHQVRWSNSNKTHVQELCRYCRYYPYEPNYCNFGATQLQQPWGYHPYKHDYSNFGTSEVQEQELWRYHAYDHENFSSNKSRAELPYEVHIYEYEKSHSNKSIFQHLWGDSPFEPKIVRDTEKPQDQQHKNLSESEKPQDQQHKNLSESEKSQDQQHKNLSESEKPQDQQHENLSESEKVQDQQPQKKLNEAGSDTTNSFVSDDDDFSSIRSFYTSSDISVSSGWSPPKGVRFLKDKKKYYELYKKSLNLDTKPSHEYVDEVGPFWDTKCPLFGPRYRIPVEDNKRHSSESSVSNPDISEINKPEKENLSSDKAPEVSERIDRPNSTRNEEDSSCNAVEKKLHEVQNVASTSVSSLECSPPSTAKGFREAAQKRRLLSKNNELYKAIKEMWSRVEDTYGILPETKNLVQSEAKKKQTDLSLPCEMSSESNEHVSDNDQLLRDEKQPTDSDKSSSSCSYKSAVSNFEQNNLTSYEEQIEQFTGQFPVEWERVLRQWIEKGLLPYPDEKQANDDEYLEITYFSPQIFDCKNQLTLLLMDLKKRFWEVAFDIFYPRPLPILFDNSSQKCKELEENKSKLPVENSDKICYVKNSSSISDNSEEDDQVQKETIKVD